jgi:putative selenate reductase
LRQQIPASYAHLRDLPYPTRLSDTVTLSTFHGCPPQEIEGIAEFLLRDVGLNVVVKLNPTLLGQTDLNAILHDRLGYTDIEVPDEAFVKDANWDQVQGFVDRLGRLADSVGRGFGVKFTNTLLVHNHKRFFPADAKEMYLSGPPLHVLAMTLIGRFREAFGDRFPISFSAGIDAANFADAVALGLKPVTVCSDLLKNGGYGRGSAYLKNLVKRMAALDVRDIDTFVIKAFGQGEAALSGLALPAERESACRASLSEGGDPRTAAGPAFDAWVSAALLLNTRVYGESVLADPRYGADQTDTPPKKTGVALGLFDCQTCDRCVSVCPNDAIFRFALPREPVPLARLIPGDGGWKTETTGSLPITRPHQIGIFADACNECGNCDVICPEDGAPYALKPLFFGSLTAWSAAPARDGFFVEAMDDGIRIHGRLAGAVVTLDSLVDGTLRYRDDGTDLTLDPADPVGSARGHASGPVDLARIRIMAGLGRAVTEETAVNYISAALP